MVTATSGMFGVSSAVLHQCVSPLKDIIAALHFHLNI